MDDELIYRLASHTGFSHGEIKDYEKRVSALAEIIVYNILEAAAMNLPIDLLGRCGSG